MKHRVALALAMAVGWTALWVALWRDLSIANIIAGGGIASLLLLAFPPQLTVANRGRIRLVPALRFAAYLGRKILQANLVVAWEVITPKNKINEGVVAIPIRGVSEGLIALVANSISLAPGTLTLDTHTNPNTIYLHVLHLHDIDAVRRSVQHLELLAIEAFGNEEAVRIMKAQEGSRE